MIEFIATELCTGCNRCVDVCPGDVFETVEAGPPSIARLADCQSCRQCALHCPEGAVLVTLLAEPSSDLDRAAAIASGRLTAYGDWLGWKNGRNPPGDRSGTEEHYINALREKRGAREVPDPADRVRRQLHEAQDRNYI